MLAICAINVNIRHLLFLLYYNRIKEKEMEKRISTILFGGNRGGS